MSALKYGVAIAVLLIAACDKSDNTEIYNENNTNVLNGIVLDTEEKPINGIYKTYYGNGTIKMEMTAKNGVPNGEGRFYDENGNLQFSGNFENGKINGKFYQYYDDGNIHNELTYINGVQSGAQILYDNNGQKAAEVTYTNNHAISGYVIIEGEQIPLEDEDLANLSQGAFSDIADKIPEIVEDAAENIE